MRAEAVFIFAGIRVMSPDAAYAAKICGDTRVKQAFHGDDVMAMLQSALLLMAARAGAIFHPPSCRRVSSAQRAHAKDARRLLQSSARKGYSASDDGDPAGDFMQLFSQRRFRADDTRRRF
ncbi:hypothetical protein AVEN_148153-1 [Araneus ventricosus]|uniref:Uncharacterized protein n=1 Tax=Araneus ventricosus TaxID=182803 RepID=A0A4Y2F367_ARAVE|nr:hypothetical protein AVEN_148153-1 [Araneus ventricosus]